MACGVDIICVTFTHYLCANDCTLACVQDYDIDDLVDVIEGSRVYVPAIYAVNKIDQVRVTHVWGELQLEHERFV